MAVKREQVVQTAEKYVARGKIEPAIREYRKLLEENPNDINTLNRVGDLYARIQRIDEAVDFFNQIAEQYAGEGFFVKAIAIYKKIIKLDPTRLDVYENLAELYHRQGLVTEARTQYQVLADYYQKHENATSTIAIYQKMADLEPNNPTYHVKLAELYQGQKLVEKAMGEYRVIAELMIEHGHPQEAAQVYERALAIDSTNIGFVTDAALKLKEAAGAAAASRFLAAAVERNPQAAQVARLIGAPAGLGGGLADPHAGASVADHLEAAATTAADTPRRVAPHLVPEPPAHQEETAPEDYYALEPDVGAERPAPFAQQEPELSETDLEVEIELDLGSDLVLEDLAPPGAPAGIAEEPGAYQAGGAAFESGFQVEEDDTPASPPAAGAQRHDHTGGVSGSRELPGGFAGSSDADDLDDVFVLDIEDEEEPASLVKPPPDMLQQPRRPSWAQEGAPLEPPLSGLNVLGSPGAAPGAGLASGTPPASPPLPPSADALGDLPDLPELPRLTGEFALINPFTLLTEAAPQRPPSPGVPPPAPAGVPLTEPEAEPGAGAPAGEEIAPPLLRIDSELLERTAAEVQPQAIERYEDLVSEAEVLAKYGLEEKAIERLREAVRIKPRQLSAYFLLIQLQLDKGRFTRVMELANQVARLTAESADRDTWPKLRKRLLAAGFRVEGERVVALPEAGARETGARPVRPRGAPQPAAAEPLPSAAPAGVGPDAMPADAQAAVALPALPPESEPLSAAPAPAEIAAPEVEPPAAPPPATAAAPPRRPARAGDGGIERMLQGLMERPSPAVRGPRPATAPPPVTPESPAAAGEPASPAAAAGQAAEAPAAALPAAGAAPAGETDLPAAPPEDDFYELPPLLEAGAGDALPGEEPPVIFNPLEIGAMVESEEIDWDDEDDTQGGPGAVWMPPRPSQAASGDEPAPGAPAEPAAAVQPNPTLDDTGMSWLDEADSGKDDNAARAASLFDEEEDFFDLAGELEQELSQEAAFQESDLLPQQEQSLEEIVEGFKKGVAEHLSPTDYDTHYNLGIAYREMGLLDEAIGEFQLSAKDARYLVSCCSMLGLCFLDKGLPELAIKWYRRGLEAEQIAEDDTLGLLYDMGCAYLAMGDSAGAYKTFVDVYGINTNYRDVVARIEELGHPH